MRTHNKALALRASVLAVQGALAMFAMVGAAAADTSAEVKELTYTENRFELGATAANHHSAKASEYDGTLTDKYTTSASLELNGGEQGVDSTSAYRWKFRANDLGTNSPSAAAEWGVQGSYRLNVGYDELKRNFSDTYLTPYAGAGTSNLTLPAYYAAAHTTTNNVANWNNIQSFYQSGSTSVAGATQYTGLGPAQLLPGMMHEFDLGVTRKRSEVGYSDYFAENWEFRGSIKREDKTGAKLTGVAMGGFKGALLPEPIDFRHEQFEASVRHLMKNGQITIGYYGSLFKNNTNVWTADYPFATVANATTAGWAAGRQATMSGAPDNEMHQLNVSGMYKFTPTTIASLAASYGERRQNEQFNFNRSLLPNTTVGSYSLDDPSRTSLDGKVITTNVDLKLTARPFKDVSLLAAYKYDDKDNRTKPMSVHAAGSIEAAVANATLLGAANEHDSHAPSKKVQKLTFEGDYALTRSQGVKLGYEREEIERSCSSNISADCIYEVGKTYEDTVRAEYRRTLGESLNGRVSYAYSERRADNYEDDPSQLAGTRRAYIAPYNREKVRSQVSYQATDAWSLGGTVDITKTDYLESLFGMTKQKGWAVGLDSTLTPSEDLTLTAYYSYEDSEADIKANARSPAGTATPVANCADITGTTQPTNSLNDPCRNWGYNQNDRVHTVGFSAKQKGLMKGKLEVTADLAYSHATSPIDMSGGGYFSNGTNLIFVRAEDFPAIKSRLVDFKLTGLYALDKASAVRVGYRYQRLSTEDWQWDSYAQSQLGVLAVQAYIGPGITSPDYEISSFGVAYVYAFR